MNQEIFDSARRQSGDPTFQRIVVGAVVVHNNEVLLLQRHGGDFMGGVFEIPSGKVEEGESLEDALYREVKEESGIRVKDVKKLLSPLEYVSQSGKKTRQINFLVIPETPINLVISEEHSWFLWIPLKEIQGSPLIDDAMRKILSGM
jgi:8-oxo-dGTP diphosphatase